MKLEETDSAPEEIARLREQLVESKQEIAKLQDRVAKQEEALADLQNDEQADEGREISLAQVLENPEVTKIVSTAVDSWAKTRPDEMKLRFRSLHLGVMFSLFVFSAIGILGYLGVITKDVTAGLLGALIGYWYGKQRKDGK